MSGPEDWDFDRRLSKIGKLKVLGNLNIHSNDSSDEYAEVNLKKWIGNFKSFLAEKGIEYNADYRNALFHNESDFNFRNYLNKKNYYVKGFSIYIDKWGRYDIVIKKQFGISYRYFGVFIENGKWKKLVTHPVLTSGMYALRFIVGII